MEGTSTQSPSELIERYEQLKTQRIFLVEVINQDIPEIHIEAAVHLHKSFKTLKSLEELEGVEENVKEKCQKEIAEITRFNKFLAMHTGVAHNYYYNKLEKVNSELMAIIAEYPSIVNFCGGIEEKEVNPRPRP